MQIKTLWIKLKLNKVESKAWCHWVRPAQTIQSHSPQFPSSVNQNWEVWYMEALYFALGQTKVVQKNLIRLHPIRSDLVYSTNECLMLVEIKRGQHALLKFKCETLLTSVLSKNSWVISSSSRKLLISSDTLHPWQQWSAGCTQHHICIRTLTPIDTALSSFLSTSVLCHQDTTCSEAVWHSGGSLLCLWQHCALQHWTLWKRTANNVPQDTTFREEGGGRAPYTANESNTGTPSPIWKGQRGHLVHAALQMVLCQEIADEDSCALLVPNWKWPKHSVFTVLRFKQERTFPKILNFISPLLHVQ